MYGQKEKPLANSQGQQRHTVTGHTTQHSSYQHQTLNAELALLKCLIAAPVRLVQELKELEGRDFYADHRQLIFKAWKELATAQVSECPTNPVDPVLLLDKLNQFNAGELAHADLMAVTTGEVSPPAPAWAAQELTRVVMRERFYRACRTQGGSLEAAGAQASPELAMLALNRNSHLHRLAERAGIGSEA